MNHAFKVFPVFLPMFQINFSGGRLPAFAVRGFVTRSPTDRLKGYDNSVPCRAPSRCIPALACPGAGTASARCCPFLLCCYHCLVAIAMRFCFPRRRFAAFFCAYYAAHCYRIVALDQLACLASEGIPLASLTRQQLLVSMKERDLSLFPHSRRLALTTKKCLKQLDNISGTS